MKLLDLNKLSKVSAGNRKLNIPQEEAPLNRIMLVAMINQSIDNIAAHRFELMEGISNNIIPNLSDTEVYVLLNLVCRIYEK